MGNLSGSVAAAPDTGCAEPVAVAAEECCDCGEAIVVAAIGRAAAELSRVMSTGPSVGRLCRALARRPNWVAD